MSYLFVFLIIRRPPIPTRPDTLLPSTTLFRSLVLVPPAPFANPGHFVHTSRRIAEETDNAFWANQLDNIANRKSHIFGSAEAIWDQMDGRIDGFTGDAGTGGTIAGTGTGRRETGREHERERGR